MLRGRLQLSDATTLIGIRKADLARLLDGRPCYTQLKAPLAAGTVVVICQHFSGQTIKLLFGSPHRPLGPGCH